MPAPLATTAASPYLNKPLRSLEQAANDADHRRRVEGPVEQLDPAAAAGPADNEPAAGGDDKSGGRSGRSARVVDITA